MAEKIRVLYVDDESALLELGKVFLEKICEFSVHTLSSAQEALTLLKDHPVDAIISDYQMPAMDGIEFLKAVRACGDKTPFIIFTGKGREDVVIEALNSGADFYLQKGGEAKAQFAELSNKIRYAVSRKRAEEALQESEAKFRSVIENIPDVIWTISSDGRTVFISPRVETVFGFTPEEIYLEDITLWMERIHPDDAGKVKEKFYELFERPEFFDIEYRIQRKDQQWIWLHDRAVTTYEKDGIGYADGIFSDITERKQAEAALKKSQVQLAEAMDLAYLVNWEFDVASGIFTFNDRFYALYGTTAEREGGYQIPAEVYAREFVHPDEVDLVANEVQNAINATDPNYTRNIEHRIIRRDGEIRHIIVRIAITKDDQGRTVKTHGANQDITERKIAEMALRESEEKYRMLFENANDGIVVHGFTPEGLPSTFTDVNDIVCRQMGYSREELLTLSPREIDAPETWAAAAARVQKLLEQGHLIFEGVHVRKDGEQYPVEISAHVFYFKDQKITLALWRDITGRKKAEEALQFTNTILTSQMEATIDGILVVDESGKIISYNHRFIEIWEIPPDVIASRSDERALQSVLHKLVDPDEFLTRIRYLYTHKEEKSREEIRLNDNRTLDRYSAPMIGSDGRHYGRIWYFRDITDRKQVEEALRENEERYREFFTISRDCVFITSPEGRWIDFNDATLELFGYASREELSKVSITSLYAQPEERAGFIHLIEQAGYVQEHPMRLKQKDGTVIDTLITTVPVRNPDGSVKVFIGTIRDITERKRAEEALRESEARYRVFIDSTDDLAYLKDDQFRYLIANRALAVYFGRTETEILKKTDCELMPEQNACLCFESDKKVFESDAVLITEERLGDRVFETHKFKVPLIDGTYGIGGYIKDITERKHMEEALRGREALLVKSQEIAHVGSWELDTVTNHLTWSDEVYRIFGMSPQEFAATYEAFLDSVHPEDRTAVDTAYTGSLREGRDTYEIEHRVVRKDTGEIRFVHEKCIHLRDAAGHIVRSIGMVQDVTERKRVEEALQLHAEIERNMSDAVYLVRVSDAMIVYTNPSFERLLGYDPGELVGRHVSIVNAPVDKLPEEIASEIISSLTKTGSWAGEVLNLRKDGSTVWCQANVFTFDHPRYGKVWLSIHQDITERKRAEEALRQSEEKYRILFENMLDGFAYCRMIYDSDGHPEDLIYLNVNREFDRIIDIKNVTGKLFTKVFPGVRQAYPELFEIYSRVSLTGIPESFEIDFKPIEKWLRISVYSPEKEFFVAVFEDITERKRAEEGFQKANKQLNLLSSITRHDIFNQLLVLKGYIDLSRDYLDDKKTLSDFLEKEGKAARTIEHQIRFTKDYQDLGVAPPEWQNVNASITKAVAGLPMRDIHVEIDPKNPEVFADRLFEKVFYNLIDNALKYGGDQIKTIRVSSQVSDASLTVLCEDDGAGISADDKKKLFTRGFGKNTGFGLFLSREILAITGITISENGEPGKGARFEITVPKGIWRITGNGA